MFTLHNRSGHRLGGALVGGSGGDGYNKKQIKINIQ